MQEEFRVGVISNTHGIKGELKVFSTTDDIQRFKQLKKIRLVDEKRSIEVELQSVRFFKSMAIIKLLGYDDINAVEGFKGMDIMIDRQAAVKLEENEYFISDMIGIQATLEDGRFLGTVTEVISTGANEVFEIESPDYGMVLIPSIKECVKELNIADGILVISPIDGMLGDSIRDTEGKKE